jgi:hypothetical protein
MLHVKRIRIVGMIYLDIIDSVTAQTHVGWFNWSTYAITLEALCVLSFLFFSQGT